MSVDPPLAVGHQSNHFLGDFSVLGEFSEIGGTTTLSGYSVSHERH